MTCSSCGTENRPGRKFCSECAAPLSVACSACGAANEPGEKFCGECATPLPGGGATAPAPVARPSVATSAPAPGPAPAPVAERRLVSVLFADLVGFTPFAEERDSEEVRETLSRYFELASDVITRYGGTVEKFIGDAVMALWGAPVAREDDAERAVRAGLELVDAVKALGPGIAARAGVLTGEAAVTLGASNQGMVAGDLVNTAARLQSVAPPGAVLVGEPTYRAASAAIAFEEAGDQILKGKTTPVPAWRALRVVAERGGRNRADTLESPFVGREDEFRLLKDLLHATGREKRARLVSVIGPAGIGKSRLTWEFLKYVDGLLETVWWHQGRSPAYGEGITFWALGEMVRSRCGLLETDDERTTRSKVAETLDRFVPDPDDRRWIEPALLTLLGLGGAGGSPEQLFAAWRTFFERLASSGTVVLAFEDLHWADSATLDFVDHLLEWSKSVPIYVVTLARPELLEKRPDWGAGKRSFTSVYLEPLPEPAMRELLGGLVPGLPEAAVRAIVGRADGIPLYAVETVRMLVAEGRLREEAGVYVPVGDLTTLSVPETLTALIASRLDGLEPADRALLSDAAVLGQSFTLAGLSAVSGIDPAALEPRLRALVRRELLTLEADPRSPERGQYAFVQALIREVAYNTLAKKDRKTRHLAAARFFESLDTDELAGGLAGHYLAAHANAPDGPEADALAGQARIALRAAADRAAGLGAHDQAVRFYEQAITVTPDRAEQADLLERAGDAASQAAHHEAAASFLRRAVELNRARGDRTATARSIAGLGRVLTGTYDVEGSRAVLEPAVVEFADLGDDPVVVALVVQLARAYVVGEDHARAVEMADRALAAAERLDLVPAVAEGLAAKGSSLANLGRTYEGLNLMRGAVELADANGLSRIALNARVGLAAALGSRDPAAAMAIGRAGLDDSRRLGLRHREVIFVGNAAEVARWTGDWDWALGELAGLLSTDLEDKDRAWLLGGATVLRGWRGESIDDDVAEAERLLESIDSSVSSIDALDLRASLAVAAGRFDEARTDLHEVARLSPLNAPTAYPAAARAALWAGDPDGAAGDLAAFEATGARGPIIDLRKTVIRAGIAALHGRPAEARSLYAEATRGIAERGIAFEAALGAIDMATLLDPSDPEVRAAADAARETLVRLRAAPFLERLEAAMARSRDQSGRSTERTAALESAEAHR